MKKSNSKTKKVIAGIWCAILMATAANTIIPMIFNSAHADVVSDNVTAMSMEMWVNISTLNVRIGPDTDYDILGTLSYGQAVMVTGQTANGWYQILYNDQTAYVSNKYLSDTSPSESALYGAVVQPGVSQSLVNVFTSYWDMVPKYVKDYVIQVGSYVSLDPNGNATAGHAGMTTCTYYSSTGKIASIPIAHIMATTEGKVKLAAIHEIGHVIDVMLGQTGGTPSPTYGTFFMSSNPDFVEIFNAEVVKSGYGYWGVGNSNEYFAESFRYYFESPERLKKNTPRTYEYVSNILVLVQNAVEEKAP